MSLHVFQVSRNAETKSLEINANINATKEGRVLNFKGELGNGRHLNGWAL
jgi:hypothetical protein